MKNKYSRQRRRLGIVITALATAWGLPIVAAAQGGFPSKPITIVVPYSAGGTTDLLARMLQEPLQKALGQVVLIDNRPGASAMLGTRVVARAAPDGYTLLFANNGLVISPHITRDAGYQPLTDFVPVSLLCLQPMVFLVNAAVPAKTLREFIDYAKANPGKVDYASAGPASFGHLSSLLFAQDAGLALEHIPYKGQGPATQAVVTGEVKMLLSTTSAQTNGFIKEGRVRLLGVSSAQPSELVPGAVPIGQTLPGYKADVWFGMLAPAGTPRDVVAKLNEALAKVLALPDVKAKFEIAGALATASTPDQFKARMTEEYGRWATVVKSANIKAE
jgi:tripartite-type tricarboxylate transporter receptor subunit TctC